MQERRGQKGVEPRRGVGGMLQHLRLELWHGYNTSNTPRGRLTSLIKPRKLLYIGNEWWWWDEVQWVGMGGHHRAKPW